MRNLGKFGEKIACQYLKKKDYKILETNYKFQIPGNLIKGEIDIIAKKGETIHFLEVKTLKNPKIEIFPEEKINFSKVKKLTLAAESWLIKNKIPLDSKWQIDVMGIVIKNGEIKISFFENVYSDFR